MKLKDVINVCDETFNINFVGKSYSTLGHEFSNVYAYPAESRYARCDGFLKKEGPRFAYILETYGDCEVVNLYGFDDGLTITIKETN